MNNLRSEPQSIVAPKHHRQECLSEDSQKSVSVPNLDYLENTKAIDSTLTKIKGNHSYYRTLMVLGSLNMFAIGFCMYSVGFLNSLPKFACPSGPGGAYQYVPEVQACAMLDQCRIEWLYDGWVKNYNMICENRTSRVFYISLIFLLNAIVFFSLTAMADIIGRNYTLKMTSTVAIGGVLFIYLIDSYPAKVILFGIVTGTSSAFQMMFTLGLKEAATSDTNLNSYQNMFLNCAYSAAPIIVSGAAYIIYSHNALSLISFCLLAICCVGDFCLYNETPLYLYRKRRGRDFINKLFVLAKLNSVTTSKRSIIRQLLEDELTFKNNQKLVYDQVHIKRTVIFPEDSTEKGIELKNIEHPADEPVQTNVVVPKTHPKEMMMDNDEEKIEEDIKVYPSAPVNTESTEQPQDISGNQGLLWITFVLFYWCSSLYLVSYGTITSVDKSGMDNLHLNQVLLGLSSVAGYGICIKFPKDVKRVKTISLLIIALLLTSGLILLLDVFAKEVALAKVVQSVCTVGLMPILVNIGFSVLYMYLPDVYPVTLRGLGIGAVICLGKIFGGVTSSYISNFMIQSGLNPIAGCAIPGIFLLVFLRTIPDC